MNDGNRALSERGAERAARGSARRTYRRLLGYLRPVPRPFHPRAAGRRAVLRQHGELRVLRDSASATAPSCTRIRAPSSGCRWRWSGLFLLRGLGDFTQTYFMGYVGRHIVSELRAEVFRHVLRLPVGYFDRTSSGDAAVAPHLQHRAGRAGDHRLGESCCCAPRSPSSARSATCCTSTCAWHSIALMIGPLMGWLVSVINRRFRRYSRRIQDSMGDVTRVAKESFEAPRLIKVYNAEDAPRAPVRRGQRAQPALQHEARS